MTGGVDIVSAVLHGAREVTDEGLERASIY
jgi:hypothetical protein